MKLTLACAYCFGAITTKLGDTELKTDRGKLDRDGKVCTIQCPHCDSTFAVHVTTKRVRKGKRKSAAEANEQAEFDARRAAAVERNKQIAAALLAQPGCTCAAYQAPDHWRWDSYRGDKQYEQNKRVAEYGHLFGSASISLGIPNPPQHDTGCPCRGSEAEATARGEKYAEQLAKARADVADRAARRLGEP